MKENKFVDSKFVMKFVRCKQTSAYNIIKNANKKAFEEYGYSYRPRGLTTLKDLYKYLGFDDSDIC